MISSPVHTLSPTTPTNVGLLEKYSSEQSTEKRCVCFTRAVKVVKHIFQGVYGWFAHGNLLPNISSHKKEIEKIDVKDTAPAKISSLLKPNATITDLENYPYILANTFSFLSDADKQCAHLACKKWDCINSQKTEKSLSPIIENGYGDFILLDTTGKPIPHNVFKKAFRILNEYLPQVQQKPLENRLQEVNRVLHEKLPGLPHLKAVFIPRTLYELLYLAQGFDEEIELHKKNYKDCQKLNDCCHSFIFKGEGSEDNLKPKQIRVAHRLNDFIIKELGLIDTGMTVPQFKRAGKAILDRFKKIDSISLKIFPESIYPILNRIHKAGVIDPLNLKNIIALECDKASENSIVLYRGSRFQKEPLSESVVDNNEKTIPYAASFGIGLFAGYLKDPSACAALRMFYDQGTRASYALRIPLEGSWQEAFDIPPVNTICGLNGEGELFHARSKCLKPSEDANIISGYYRSHVIDRDLARFVSPLNQEKLQEKLDSYQAKRVELITDPHTKRGSTHLLSSAYM